MRDVLRKQNQLRNVRSTSTAATHLGRTMTNKANEKLPRTHEHSSGQGFSVTATRQFGQDFSRIPVRGEALAMPPVVPVMLNPTTTMKRKASIPEAPKAARPK
jgi:hypothetical protein